MVKHPVILRGYHAPVSDRITGPVLAKRTDQEFLPGVLDGFRRKLTADELGRPDALVRSDVAAGALRLFQPVHRTFNVALLEAVCDGPGFPRLNPRDIASAGFVVRRVKPGGEDEAWLLRDERVLGWGTPVDPEIDPDPRQRRPRLNAGNPYVNGKLALLHAALEPAAERVSPLFVAPPDVCTDAGRTLLYGLVPVTSAERSDDVQPAEVSVENVNAIMPDFLRNGAPAFTVPDPALTDLNSGFVQDLRLIQFGWRTFDNPRDGVMLNLLHNLEVRFSDGHSRRLDDYLEELCGDVILRNKALSDLQLPQTWPRPDAGLAISIRDAAKQSLEASVRASLPNEQRFDRVDALYRIHAFVRVRCPDGCPPVLQWSRPSAPFGIVPWWESDGRPLHTITLPDVDRNSLKLLKPNVSFTVPKKLAAVLKNNSLKDLLDGKGTDANGGIDWICSFSIPIITICAFIVLNIFLTLFHIIFQWLFYIKICLPFPKRR